MRDSSQSSLTYRREVSGDLVMSRGAEPVLRMDQQEVLEFSLVRYFPLIALGDEVDGAELSRRICNAHTKTPQRDTVLAAMSLLSRGKELATDDQTQAPCYG